MDFFYEFFRKPVVRRILIFALIGGLLYLMKDLLSLFLLTFLFIFIVNSAQKFLYRHIKKIIPINRRIIIVALYTISLGLFIVLAYLYVPVIIRESSAIIHKFMHEYKEALNDTSDNLFVNSLVFIGKNIDLSQYYDSGSKLALSALKNIGVTSLFIFLSFILSMFFMLEKKRILAFMHGVKYSKISWLYDEMSYFGSKFTNSFGKVIQTQIIIALINTALSTIAFWLLGFPNILGLAAMFFILGLIPVAGVFISLIPLAIIAYNIGGVQKVIYVLILIAVLHALESYVLNPKLMSDRTKLPVFFTFLILIISEHFLGIWGLIIGLPIAMFILDVLEITPTGEGEKTSQSFAARNGIAKAISRKVK